MQKQKENLPVGPFRATRLWDEAVRIFTQGMPRKRHRLHMRLYEDSFTGSEAIKWFHQALEMSPHFNAVITQEKTHQLLNKFYEEGIFVKVRDSGRDGGELFKLHGLYQISQEIKPQYTARTPLSTKYVSNSNQRSENWIRRSLHKDSLPEFDDIQVKKNSTKACNEGSHPFKPSSVSKEPQPKAYFRNPQACVIHDKPCKCESWRSGKAVQHPVQQRRLYEQKQNLSPSHMESIWREVFSRRLQTLLPDLDVCGLLWPCAIIRCQWLERNCSQEDCSVAKLPPWVKASTNRLLQALSDRNLNRSVVNLDIEADVSAMEAYFGNLQSPLIPADLCALFLRVFLHLEMVATPSIDDDAVSIETDKVSFQSDECSDSSSFEENHSSLPPNTCFETAFTSASPVTRIVPQCSFDTLHLRPVSACTLTKRNMSAPKLLEACSDTREDGYVLRKSTLSQSTLTGLCDTKKYSTLDGTHRESRATLKTDSMGGSLHRKLFPKTSQHYSSPSCTGRFEEPHNCGQLKVLDKTPPNYRNRIVQGKSEEKHGRSHSGGYVNLGLQESFDGQDIKNGELDLDAAMESLNKLILCSQSSAFKKDTLHHGRSASLFTPQVNPEKPAVESQKSQSCCSQDVSIVSTSATASVKINSSSSDAACSLVDSCSSLTAGCEWGWDWGSDIEKTGVAVFHMLTLLLPPQSRGELKVLLKLMGLLPYQCPYTTIKVLEMFSSCIVPCGDEDVTARFLGFMVRHHQEIFLPPDDLVAEVEHYKKSKWRTKFEEQKLTNSQKALAELLDQIINDEKINPKEKAKKLKMFKEAYPHIYSLKFPNAENVLPKSRPRSILQLARLRSLRV